MFTSDEAEVVPVDIITNDDIEDLFDGVDLTDFPLANERRSSRGKTAER